MATIGGMPYPRKLLNDNESIVLDLHPHWWFYAVQSLSTMVVVILGFSVNANLDGWSRTGAASLVLGALVLTLGWLIVTLVKWRTTYFVVTNHRLISRQGMLARNSVDIPLDRIANVNFKQSILERLVGVGDILIESAGKDSAQTFSDIGRPDAVQKIIHEAIADRTEGRFMPAPSSIDMADQLERLEALRDRGSLTDEEFEQQKRRLLG